MAFTISVQAIKPGALKLREVQIQIEKALVDEAKVLQREFKKTTESWTGTKPGFDYKIHVSGKEASVHCFPSGMGREKWRRIDEGTKQNYPITPKKGKYRRNKPLLVYQSRFSPKTTPRQLQSGPGGKSGPYDVRVPMVIHPGVTPREWSETLGKQEIDPFVERVQQAVDRGLA